SRILPMRSVCFALSSRKDGVAGRGDKQEVTRESPTSNVAWRMVRRARCMERGRGLYCDLTDEEGALPAPLIPAAKQHGGTRAFAKSPPVHRHASAVAWVGATLPFTHH